MFFALNSFNLIFKMKVQIKHIWLNIVADVSGGLPTHTHGIFISNN